MSTTNTHAEIESGTGNTLRGCVRLVAFFVFVVATIPFQLLSRMTSRIDSFEVSRLLYRSLAWMMGFKVRVRGTMTTAKPTLFVSSHSSYLDVMVLGSVIPAAFVAKDDIAKWPFIGWISKLQRTVFIERRSVRAAAQRDSMRAHLERGESLILFPEGTSSDGLRTLPFKSSLFSLAAERLPDGRPVTVQPISVVCTEISGMPIGRAWRPFYAWYGEMTFSPHLWRVFKLGSFTVDIVFHPPVTIAEFADRKEMARHCHAKVAEGVDQCLTGRIKD